jgi:hypothetical protein
MPPVYQLAPLLPADTNIHDGGAALLARTLHSMSASEDDILIAGLFGNHFNEAAFALWETFCSHFISNVVNTFPGRVILLGANQQHFHGTGVYNKDDDPKRCGPFLPSMQDTIGAMESRQLAWDSSIVKYLDHSRVRVVDVSQILARFWMCHRKPEDCTHWNDAVYSVLAGLVLQALESLEH